MNRKIGCFINIVIAIISLITNLMGNILLSIGKGEITIAIKESHMPLYQILGYCILISPVITSVVFNLIMVLKHNFKSIQNTIQYLVLITIINISPYILLYIFLN